MEPPAAYSHQTVTASYVGDADTDAGNRPGDAAALFDRAAFPQPFDLLG